MHVENMAPLALFMFCDFVVVLIFYIEPTFKNPIIYVALFPELTHNYEKRNCSVLINVWQFVI